MKALTTHLKAVAAYFEDALVAVASAGICPKSKRPRMKQLRSIQKQRKTLYKNLKETAKKYHLAKYGLAKVIAQYCSQPDDPICNDVAFTIIEKIQTTLVSDINNIFHSIAYMHYEITITTKDAKKATLPLEQVLKSLDDVNTLNQQTMMNAKYIIDTCLGMEKWFQTNQQKKEV